MKKVLIITYYWPPSGGAGVQRWLKMSKYLPEFGIEPIIITVDPNYASYPQIDQSLLKEISPTIRVLKTKTREPFGLYKKLLRKKLPSGGFSESSKKTATDKILRFLRSNFFIPDPRKGWNYYAFKEAERIISSEEIVAVITTSPPHSTQLVGLRLKKKYNLPWIADLRDPWTDIYYYQELYHSKLSRSIDLKWEQKVILAADKICVVSEAIKKLFADKHKVDKICVVPNGFDEADFTGINVPESGLFSVLYVGTTSDKYEIPKFLVAFKKCLAAGLTNLRIEFTGIISSDIKRFIEENMLWDFVKINQYKPHREAVADMLKADMLLLSIPNQKNNEGILTGKLFEYLATRNLILGIGPPAGDAASILTACNAGKMFEYTDAEGIGDFIAGAYVKKEKGLLLRNDSEEVTKFSRKYQAKQISEVIEECVA